MRKLEIGPGKYPLKGFEHMDIVERRCVQHVADAGGKLPFNSNTFGFIYASHVIEHLPWYNSNLIMKEWVRILDHGGEINVWTPNAAKVAQCILDAESGTLTALPPGEKWKYRNKQKNPFRWAAARLFATNVDKGRGNESWHHALFTPRYLSDLMKGSGLINVTPLEKPLGYDHGWTNMGFSGTKP